MGVVVGSVGAGIGGRGGSGGSGGAAAGGVAVVVVATDAAVATAHDTISRAPFHYALCSVRVHYPHVVLL